MIARLTTQQACIDLAARLIADQPGVVLEIGLGKGRTLDHMREVMPEREIFAFDRFVHAPAAVVPDDDHLFLGDFQDTLAAPPDALKGQAVFAHADIGSEDRAADAVLAPIVADLLARWLRPGAVVATDREMNRQGWQPLPDLSAMPWPYFIYRT
jgi:hypothetical protein